MDHTEVEWQFEAGNLSEVAGWLTGRAGIVAGDVREIRDTYLDAGDWRLYRAGYALRLRRSGGGIEATMKALAPAEDGVRRRREISEPLGSGGAEALARARGPVGQLLHLLLGDRELRELFEVRTRRRIFYILPEGSMSESGGSSKVVVDAAGEIRRRGLDDAVALGEVALDDVEIAARGSAPARLLRVEVEAAPDAPDDAAAGVAAEMREALGLRPACASKFETGLSVAGLAPDRESDLGPTEISAGQPPAGEAAFAMLRRHFAAMLTHEPGVRIGENPEELHDMRVAIRRLRSVLGFYADYLPKRAQRFERELKRLAGALGKVRDLDVQLENLEAMISDAAGEEREAVETVYTLLKRRRAAARRRMLEALDSGRYERLIVEMSAFLRRERARRPSVTILEALPVLARQRYEKVRRIARRIDASSPPEEFHDLRKKCGHLRYALEPLADLYGRPARRMVKRLKELQDRLGEQQDLVLFEERLREIAATEDLPARMIFTMGSLASGLARRAAELRAGISGSKALRAVRKGRGWEKLRKAMEERPPEKDTG